MGKQRKIHVPAKCKCCGKDFIITSPYHPQKFCSRGCGTKYRHMQQGHTKEEFERKILAFIRERGRFCMRKEIQECLHVSDNTFRVHNIDFLALNAAEGYYESERRRKNIMLEQALLSGKYHRVTDALNDLGMTMSDLNHCQDSSGGLRALMQKAGIQYSQSAHYPTKESIEDAIIAELKKEGRQLPAAELVRRLHFDYQRAVRYGIKICDMHKKAGIPYTVTTSYFETRFDIKASAQFAHVHTQYRFDDCISPVTGRRLHFDFYIEDVNTLVEIDGEQHTNKNHKLYTEKLAAHDRKKESYAAEHGIRLIRIPTVPKHNFEDRVDHILNELKSGSCKTH